MKHVAAWDALNIVDAAGIYMSYLTFLNQPDASRRLCLGGAAGVVLASILPAAAQSPNHGGYRLGDRLDAGTDALGELRPDGYRKLGWAALRPPGFDPMKDIRTQELMGLRDSDPRAIAAFEQMRRSWMNAPPVSALDNLKVLIAGFAVPLTTGRFGISEFLLVPNFGACIHVPPPPSNQVIHVILENPDLQVHTMGAYWVGGILRVSRSKTSMGAASYTMKGRVVAVYHQR